jgi:Phage integrase family
MSEGESPTKTLVAGSASSASSARDPCTVKGRWWLRATRAAGVEGLRFHDLRHSAATLALAAGANTRELMERMGHSSPQVALRYQHVMAGRDQAIAAALDELVQAAATLPTERPSERPSGTLAARTGRTRSGGAGRRARGGR